MDQLPPFVSANMVNRNTLLFSKIGFLKRNKMDTMVCRPHFKISVNGTRIFGFATLTPRNPVLAIEEEGPLSGFVHHTFVSL